MIRVGLMGAGGIVRANHIPGLALCPDTQITAVCDPDEAAVARARVQLPEALIYKDYHQLLDQAAVDAVVIATPNREHAPIALAAMRAGKHVLCEKPLAMSSAQAREMASAAEAAGVCNMTAFTYRFVPAMRYMKHLVQAGSVGQPYHFRANRFQDMGNRAIGWRQVEDLAGSGELGDMLSHRIDYAHFLVGSIHRVLAHTRLFVAKRVDASGASQRADVEDWVAFLADFTNDATGVFESSKLATGRGFGGSSHDYCEINGSEGSLVFFLHRPHVLLQGKPGCPSLEEILVPESFLKPEGSPRDPHAGDPLQVFRYDQSFEFIEAIRNHRPACPSFHDGARVQVVIDAALVSAREGRWVDTGES